MNNINRAINLIERDHGGCDQNTCTLSVALRHGFDLIAIDHWIGSGAASNDFPNDLPYTLQDIQSQSKEMRETIVHVDCPHCNAVLWCPEECDYWCDSCNKQIKK